MALEQLKRELELFGEQHDGAQHSRGSKMLNITRDTGELLAVLVQTRGAQVVLEIGTSNGYSTLWLAEAAKRLGGRVTTIEMDEGKRAMAATNFERAGLDPWIEQLAGDAGTLLPTLPKAAYQLIFLDSDRRHYQAWWPEIQRLLAPRGLLVVDNAVSHREELAEWMAEVEQDPA
ncbi:TPA: class I SAM-dependent methyltransferase, partial [Aeromonas dhakensis]|nr:class I SAM-dependent methyltransferase [Aeromonas dhakensis]